MLGFTITEESGAVHELGKVFHRNFPAEHTHNCVGSVTHKQWDIQDRITLEKQLDMDGQFTLLDPVLDLSTRHERIIGVEISTSDDEMTITGFRFQTEPTE